MTNEELIPLLGEIRDQLKRIADYIEDVMIYDGIRERISVDIRDDSK